MKAIVARADRLETQITTTFQEYAQARGFFVDATRVRRPKDKPRVAAVDRFTSNAYDLVIDGQLLMENRNGLIVDMCVTPAHDSLCLGVRWANGSGPAPA